MAKFEICIHGQNFLVERQGEVKKHSFYAARFIEAKDTTTAVEMAMNSLRKDLKGQVLNDESDSPELKIVDIRDVYFFEKTMVFEETELIGEGFFWDD